MPAHRSRRAARALAHLPEADPGLAVLAIWCDTRDTPGPATYLSGEVIHIGSDFTALPLQEQIGLLGHHVLHVALRHEVSLSAMQDRFGAAFDPALHNLASDALVNEILLRGGHALPRPAIRLHEVLERALPEEIPSSAEILSIWDEDRLWVRLRGVEVDAREALDNYTCSRDFAPDIRLGPVDADAAARSAEWRAHLIRAQQAGGAAGRGVGTLLRQLERCQVGTTPWERRLRRLLAKALTPDPEPRYRRPRSAWIAREDNALRRGGPRPAFEPALLRSPHRPRVVVGIDTSDSIDDAVLSLFSAEVTGLARRTGAETRVLCFDEGVYSRRDMHMHDPHSAFRALRFRRGGGTNFEEVIAEAQALDPSVILLMTDAMGTFGPRPRAPVIWACPQRPPSPPPFGTVIELLR